MVQPINVIFRYLQQQTKVSLWLYDNVDFRIEGRIVVSSQSIESGNMISMTLLLLRPGLGRVYECGHDGCRRGLVEEAGGRAEEKAR